MNERQILKKVRAAIKKHKGLTNKNLTPWLSCVYGFAVEFSKYVQPAEIDNLIDLLVENVSTDNYDVNLLVLKLMQELYRGASLEELFALFFDGAAYFVGSSSQVDEVKEFFEKVVLLLMFYRNKARAEETKKYLEKRMKELSWHLIIQKEEKTEPQEQPQQPSRQEQRAERSKLFLSDFKTLRRGENHSFMEIFDTILTDILLLIFGEIEL